MRNQKIKTIYVGDTDEATWAAAAAAARSGGTSLSKYVVAALRHALATTTVKPMELEAK